MYVMGFLCRAPHLAFVVHGGVSCCPTFAWRVKKRLQNYPLGYEHYASEFDFTCDMVDPPCNFDVNVPAHPKYIMKPTLPPSMIRTRGDTTDEENGGSLGNDKIEIDGRSKFI